MHYMLMFFETTAEVERRNDPERAPAYWGAWNAYVSDLQKSGVVVSGNGLQPPHTATRVTLRAGKRHVQDGPLPDVKEHLGGYFVVDVRDLDAALELAARSPNVGAGHTEVRPVLPPPPQNG
ncbi:MAG TPA: YciI family protein [Polyangiaceae bacterium]|nr:YciI family protein [Polyangiaceae bacterium]